MQNIFYKTTEKTNYKSGFTLVELSIVLMIIGLLVSGILVGKDMIRAAELRSITSEKDQFQTAVNLFKNKYLGLPGDLSNATAFWGVMPTGTWFQYSRWCKWRNWNTNLQRRW
jgi:prepilin-type N-terminal cleavage/methylation domain-containing protein